MGAHYPHRRRRAGLSTDEIAVPCDGAIHRVRLDGDRPVTVDHDVLSEHVLAALGSQLPPCIAVAESWTSVLEGAFQFELFLTAAVLGTDLLRHALPSTGGAPLPPALAALDRLLAVPEDALLALASWMLRREEAADRPNWNAVAPVAKGAAEEMIQRWSGGSARVDCSLTRDEDAHLSGTRRDGVTFRVRLPWLRQVYCRGLAIVGDAFVADVLDDRDDAPDVLAARWVDDVVVTGPATLARRGDGWTVAFA